jgi:hypothetical protein
MSYGEIQPEPNCIGLYHFSGNANDSSLSGYNGTVTDATIVETGMFGQAYDFNGTSAYIKFSPSSWMLTNSCTIILWIYPDDITTNQYVSYGETINGTNQRCILLGYQDNYFNIFNKGAYPTGTASHTQIVATISTWQQIAYASDGTRLYGYKDGNKIVDVSANLNPLTGSDPVYAIGAKASTIPGSWFNGKIDEFAFYNRMLSAGEIRQIYAQMKGAYGVVML